MATLVSRATDEEITLARNEHYWAGPPAIPTVRLILDIGGRSPIAAFQAGDLDYTGISTIDAPWIPYDRDLGPSLRETSSLSLAYLGIDTTSAPFDDVRVRQAVGAAVDWDRVVSLGSLGAETQAHSMVPPGIPGGGDKNWLPAHDPELARTLLAEAGYPGGVGLPTIHFASSGLGMADGIAADLERELGMDVEIEILDAHLQRLTTDPPNMWVTAWIADFVGPNDFLGVLLESDSSDNYGHWQSPAFDQAIADALATRDVAAAQVAYERALAEIQAEVPVVPLYVEHELGAVARRPARGRGQRAGHPATRRHGVGAVSRRARVGLALALLVATSLATASATLAADPTFQPAKATSRFGVSIDVEQPATIPSGVLRVEAVVRAGPDGPTFLSEIAPPNPGQTTLRYAYPTPNGSLYPNTLVELGFRVTFDDGRIVEGPTTTVRYEDDRFTWKTVSGDIVRVHWYEGDAAFGRRALDIGEKAVEEAATLLGVDESDPIDFYIYASRDPFYDVIGPGLQENIGGLALAPIRTLFANIGPSSVADPWVSIVVPHELTHVVFGTATKNPYHAPLHWLNEGLADYIAIGFDASARAGVDRAIRDGTFMPLKALEKQFPTTASLFSLGYDESVAAIDFIVRTYGRDALVQLIRSYADGVSDDAAFSAALGVDTAAFEAAWLADLGVEAPAPFGPAPAPPGPVPPGWVAGPGQTPQPGVTGAPATLRPADPGQSTDAVGPVVLGVIIAFVLVLIAGLAVTARRLNRGEALLPTVVEGSRAPDEAPPGPNELPPDDDEVPPDDAAPADEALERDPP